MTGQMTAIRRGCAGDAGWVSALIGHAFHPLAVARWLVPDPVQRAAVLPDQFRILVDHAVSHGLLYVTTDHTAVAVWFPREATPPPGPDDYHRRLASACGEATARFQALDDLFDTHHPEQPHHHLAFLAVQPGCQGRGIGSALLGHHHARLDATGMSAYLEATSPRARDLYVRHGYHPRQPFHLPDGTPLWPMWRPPAFRR